MTSAANQAALEADHSARIYFLLLDFTGTPLRACTGTRTYSFGGNSYLGIGEIAGISDLAEGADAAARQVTITASGVDAWITEPVLNRTNYKGRVVSIWLGLLNADGALIDDPEKKFGGRMDVGSMLYDDTYVAQMICEPLASRALRPNISRYSDEDHQLRSLGDKFYDLMPQVENNEAVWGGQRVNPSGVGLGDVGPIMPRDPF